LFATDVVYTIATGINDTGGNFCHWYQRENGRKFAAGVVDTVGEP
jgi:hypothetical protein